MPHGAIETVESRIRNGARRHGRHRRRRLPLLPTCLLLLSLAAAAGPPLVRRPPMFGAFTYGGVWHGMAPVQDLESLLGRRLDVVHWFMDWNTPYDVAMVREATAGGRLPLITWQPMHQSVADIAAGRYDAVMASFADGVRRTPGLVYVRPMPEMNGDWETWSGQPAVFVRAWRRMVRVFRQHGADNVRWVWSPNVIDSPATAANAMERYWPGSAYVDVLGLDGYNWGRTRSSTRWQSFDQIFATPYARVTALGSEPVWITEVASAATGGDKAAWVRAMLQSRTFPRVRALVWFNQDKDANWRLDDSLAVLTSLRTNLPPDANATANR